MSERFTPFCFGRIRRKIERSQRRNRIRAELLPLLRWITAIETVSRPRRLESSGIRERLSLLQAANMFLKLINIRKNLANVFTLSGTRVRKAIDQRSPLRSG